jgi:hypothetical protein
LKKEESALFNPKVAAQKLESKKKPLRTKLLESNELGRTWVPRSGSSESALHSHGRSQLITKQADLKIATTGSVKKPRIRKPRDMPETKKRKVGKFAYLLFINVDFFRHRQSLYHPDRSLKSHWEFTLERIMRSFLVCVD